MGIGRESTILQIDNIHMSCWIIYLWFYKCQFLDLILIFFTLILDSKSHIVWNFGGFLFFLGGAISFFPLLFCWGILRFSPFLSLQLYFWVGFVGFRFPPPFFKKVWFFDGCLCEWLDHLRSHLNNINFIIFDGF